MASEDARPEHATEHPTAVADRGQTARAIVRYLQRDTGPAGMATAAVAHAVGTDTKRAGELLRELADDGVVERVGQPGLGGGQWRLVGDER